MIKFFGNCVENLYKSIVYLLTGRSRVTHVIAQAASISYDSLVISLVIAFVSAAVIAIQVSKQFLMSGAEAYVGGSIAAWVEYIIFKRLFLIVCGGLRA